MLPQANETLYEHWVFKNVLAFNRSSLYAGEMGCASIY
jgi:hypothetical protein